jgi:hypothetical protein
MPRSSSISSTSRRLRGNRKYNQTAWAMISGVKRWRLSLTGLLVPDHLHRSISCPGYRDNTRGRVEPDMEVHHLLASSASTPAVAPASPQRCYIQQAGRHNRDIHCENILYDLLFLFALYLAIQFGLLRDAVETLV